LQGKIGTEVGLARSHGRDHSRAAEILSFQSFIEIGASILTKLLALKSFPYGRSKLKETGSQVVVLVVFFSRASHIAAIHYYDVDVG